MEPPGLSRRAKPAGSHTQSQTALGAGRPAVLQQPPALLLDLLLDRNKRAGTTLVLVTHDAEVASRADRKIVLKDGRVVEDTLPYEATSAVAEQVGNA